MSTLNPGSVELSVVPCGAAEWDFWQLYTTLLERHPGRSFNLIPILLRRIHHSKGASNIELYDFLSQCHPVSAWDSPAIRSTRFNIRRSSFTLKWRTASCWMWMRLFGPVPTNLKHFQKWTIWSRVVRSWSANGSLLDKGCSNNGNLLTILHLSLSLSYVDVISFVSPLSCAEGWPTETGF